MVSIVNEMERVVVVCAPCGTLDRMVFFFFSMTRSSGHGSEQSILGKIQIFIQAINFGVLVVQ